MLVMLLLAYAKQVMSIMCCITGSWMDMKDNAERWPTEQTGGNFTEWPVQATVCCIYSQMQRKLECSLVDGT